MSEKIKNKINDLILKINHWNDEYFNNDNSVVSDRVYDSSLKELIELEKKYPQYVLKNSPTKHLGSSLKNKFQKIEHKKAMLSLDKAYAFSDIQKFVNNIEKNIGNTNFNLYLEPKIDGLSISLKYKDGKLIQAATRGNGSVGEDVSQNVLGIINDIPVEIQYKNEIEIRGEIYISKENFEIINKREENKFSTPRNLASGTLRQLDSEIVRERNLSCFVYEIIDPMDHNLDTQLDVINFLKLNNFQTTNSYVFNNDNLDELFNVVKEIEQKKEDIKYEIDGLVIKLNEIKYYEKIGFTSKFPKYAIAYKFDDEIIQTTLDDIFVTIGRTGVVTYNAKLKTVLLKNTMVSFATLHNYNYIKELGLNVGDEVYIKKAGEIIPKVISVARKHSSTIFNKILTCPYCNNKLIDTKTFNNQLCPNIDCSEVNIKKIIHFTSKDALNIDGLGEGIVRKFFELGFLSKIQDIYKLEKFKEQIINTKGFGPRFWSNLIVSINKAKEVPLVNLIFALGIPQLGLKNAKIIANLINSFDQIKNIDLKLLENIKDIGPITIEEIKYFLNENRNIELIDFLILQNINPTSIKKVAIKNSIFTNKNVVITGTFSINRNEIKAILESHGANVLSAISKNVDILLVGLGAGSKLRKANELNIKIIKEEEFNSILNN